MTMAKEKKIRLGFYPYTYARVSAMKGKLLKPEDYHKLLKMKLAEITKFLEESEYKKEIDELSLQYMGAELLELALNRNLQRAFEKLKKISPESLGTVVNAYLIRRDVWNIKTLLRGRFTGESSQGIKKLLLPIGNMSIAALEQLAEMETMEAMLKSLGVQLPELKEAFAAFGKDKDLFALEHALDVYYQTKVFTFAQSLKQGKLFADFLKHSIDINNVSMLLRLKREGVPKEKIMSYLSLPGYRVGKQDLMRLTDMPFEEAVAAVERKGMIQRTGKEQESLIDADVQLTNSLLRGAMLLLHQNPLSVDVILGYMLAKDIEIRNLKTLVKGRELGVEENFIEKALVIA